MGEGALAWARGEDTVDAEATGLIVGEMILMWRKILASKMK